MSKFWRLIPNQAKCLEHFYGCFRRPLALLTQHYTQLCSAVQVRSLYYGYINLIAEDEWPQRAAPSDLGSIYCGTILFITFKVPPVSVRHQADCRAAHAAQRRLAYSGLKDKLAWQIHRSPDVSSHCLSVFFEITLY